MYVFGYTADKDVVKVDLPIDVVVAKGIDPWRLDLFDLDPITLDVDGQMLRFTRIGDVAFAYDSGSDVAFADVVVAMHDGKESTCVQGSFFAMGNNRNGHDSLIVDEIKPIQATFNDCLADYLHRIYESRDAQKVWAPCPNDHLYINASSLRFQSTFYADARDLAFSSQCRFVGEMFAPITRPCPVQGTTAQVLKSLARWHPVVFGDSLPKLLHGEKVNHVQIGMELGSDENVGLAVYAALEACTESGFEYETFTRGELSGSVTAGDGITYHLSRRQLGRHHLPASRRQDQLGYGKKTVVTDRIGLFDASEQQARVLIRAPSIPSLPLAVRLRAPLDISPQHRHARTLPDVFSPQYIANDCHCEPIAPLYAELFHRATCVTADDTEISCSTGVSCEEGGVVWADLRCHDAPSQVEDKHCPPQSTWFSRQQIHHVLGQLRQRAVAEFNSGLRSSACFTAIDLRNHLIEQIDQDVSLDSDTQKRWLHLLHDVLERGRRRLLTEVGQVLSDYIFERYVTVILDEEAAPDAVSDQLQKFLHDLEKPVIRRHRGVPECRAEVITMVRNYKKQKPNGRIPFSLHARLDTPIECYVLDHLKQASKAVVSRTTAPLVDGSHSVHDILQMHLSFCDHCARQFISEAGEFRSLRPTVDAFWL